MKEQEDMRPNTYSNYEQKLLFYLILDIVLAFAVIVTGSILFMRWYHEKNRPVLAEIKAPDWYTQDFLNVNPYSRPGTRRTQVNSIVVHYVANPGTSARQNWSYFNNLADQTGPDAVSASSHYIIGIDGEILQGIPLDEVAYANYPRNDDTVSIECCHPDDTGEFSEETMKSLVRLTAWLCGELHLDEKDVIRHYDVIGKNCPKYYVENESEWKEFKKAVKKALK
ncbi:MAG: N-acetylmuramoyl-L-alanine amidase [Lachnospiraceae bacterium]|nr:N-acetylmuramoyl-L-alanine amidase [Lachnospiraceae bacterium]